MTLIEDTYGVQNRAYTPNEVESSREPSPAHIYENPIVQKDKSNKCLIIGLFIMTNINILIYFYSFCFFLCNGCWIFGLGTCCYSEGAT